MNRSVMLHLMNEGSIKDYLNKVGKTFKQQHQQTNRLVNTLDKYPTARKKIRETLKTRKKHIPKAAKIAWKIATPKQKKSFLGGAIGKILKAVGTRLIGGPVGAISSSISSQMMSKRPREEL